MLYIPTFKYSQHDGEQAWILIVNVHLHEYATLTMCNMIFITFIITDMAVTTLLHMYPCSFIKTMWMLCNKSLFESYM